MNDDKMRVPLTMTNAEYHDAPGVSKSDLDLINRSPEYYRYVKNDIREQTAAMLFGSMVHKLVLESEGFDEEYIIAPDVDRRTKKGKEIWEEFNAELKNKIAIGRPLYESAKSVAEAVKKHPIAAKLLRGGQAESSYFWDDSGVICKCRPDYLREDIKCVIDLKTTQNASPESFTKTAYDYRYHVQAAWYLRGLRECGADVENFIFIAVEKDPPYTVCVYTADDLMIQLGNDIANANFKTLCDCMISSNWYGYEKNPEIHSLSLPDWVTRKYF